MTNSTIPSPPSSPNHKPTSFKRKRLSIVLPPILDVSTKRSKSTSAPSTAMAPARLDIQLLKDYLLQGGSLTSEKQGRCLLCCACQCHSLDALQLLVSSGLPCQHLCQDDVSAVHVASAVGFIDGLSYLLSHRNESTTTQKISATTATVNINGVTKRDNHTPLYRAIQANQPLAVAFLLEKGARVDIPDRMGRFPLHIAIMNRHLDCVSYLMDYERLSKNNPSHSNITGQPKSALSPRLTHDHQSAIQDAVMAGYAPILDRLLQHHITSSPRSKQEQSDLLDLAVHWNRVECLKLLIHYGYDVNHSREKGDDTSSLLYKAVQQRKMDMVQVLRKAGAISCQNGNNPCLLYAANHGFLEMVPHLLTSCTSNDCIHQAVTLVAPLEIRQQLLSIIIHTLKTISSSSTSSTSNFNTTPLTPISP